MLRRITILLTISCLSACASDATLTFDQGEDLGALIANCRISLARITDIGTVTSIPDARGNEYSEKYQDLTAEVQRDLFNSGSDRALKLRAQYPPQIKKVEESRWKVWQKIRPESGKQIIICTLANQGNSECNCVLPADEAHGLERIQRVIDHFNDSKHRWEESGIGKLAKDYNSDFEIGYLLRLAKGNLE